MTDRRTALMNLIDKAQAAADRAEARGQIKAASRHMIKVGRLLDELDATR